MPPFKTMIPTNSRPNEWKIEQGLAGAELPVIDMTEPETKSLIFQTFPKELTKDEEAIKSVGDPNKLFVREREGWVG